MKLKFAALVIATILLHSMAGCKSDPSRSIDAMIGKLNSPEMQEAERRTGLFTGSEASVSADSVIIVFNLKSGLSLADIDESKLPALEQSARTEFRDQAHSDTGFAQGMEAMAGKGMYFVLKWRDTDGNIVRIAIPAKEML